MGLVYGYEHVRAINPASLALPKYFSSTQSLARARRDDLERGDNEAVVESVEEFRFVAFPSPSISMIMIGRSGVLPGPFSVVDLVALSSSPRLLSPRSIWSVSLFLDALSCLIRSRGFFPLFFLLLSLFLAGWSGCLCFREQVRLRFIGFPFKTKKIEVYISITLFDREKTVR